jgi:hypothetical protein
LLLVRVDVIGVGAGVADYLRYNNQVELKVCNKNVFRVSNRSNTVVVEECRGTTRRTTDAPPVSGEDRIRCWLFTNSSSVRVPFSRRAGDHPAAVFRPVLRIARRVTPPVG